jgi:acyl dehydratase
MRYPEILAIAPEPGEFVYDEAFTMLYALGIGCGAGDLGFVYERKLRAIPTMGVLMANGAGDFITRGGIDFTRIVHGEQRLTLHRPLPPSGRMVTSARCLGVTDKGREKGAVLNIECTASDAASGELFVTSTMTLFCRGDGGFGGPSTGELPLRPTPDRAPDFEVALPTLPQQAAIYRLLGDRNPLHIDPAVARAVGFEGPILHGLCTYGIAARAILQACCDNDPAEIAHLEARFSAPVYPGETILTRIWREPHGAAYECLVQERAVTVIRNGYCGLRQAVPE